MIFLLLFVLILPYSYEIMAMVEELEYFHEHPFAWQIAVLFDGLSIYQSLLPPPVFSLILKPQSVGMEGSNMKTDKFTKMVQEPPTVAIRTWHSEVTKKGRG